MPTREGWESIIRQTHEDEQMFKLLAQLLYEQDFAKNELRKKGYGFTGLNWLETVELVEGIA